MSSQDSERLARMERRQEMVIEAINVQTEVIGMGNTMIAELLEAAKKPPSTELVDLIRALAAMVAEMRGEVSAMARAMNVVS
jgi:hypothetical protein